ncbi:MAG: hypothetical protein HYY91_03590 [Candidatus Omnitrophica bacterium]|nr:hypothetical protein [Candidatus Omnitrophota bacterium]
MSPDEFLASLKGWLARHPVRRPADEPQAAYTVQVMERVRLSRPHGALLRLRLRDFLRDPLRGYPRRSSALGWLLRPQPLLAFAGAAAAAAVGFAVLIPPYGRAGLAERVDRDIEVLAQVDAGVVAGLLEESLDGVAQELQLLNQMRVAELEEAADEEAWLEDTLELLNDVEGVDAASGLSGEDASIEELLQELEQLDATVSASS